MGHDEVEMKTFMRFFSNLLSVAKSGKNQEPVNAPKPSSDHVYVSRYEEFRQQGNEFLNQRKFAAAAHAYEVALEENPQSSEAYVNLGFALTELQRTDDAKIHFNQAAQLDPDNFDAHLLQAMLAIAENNHDAALKSIQCAVQIKPDSPVAEGVLFKVFAIRSEFSKIEIYLAEKNGSGKSRAEILYIVAVAFSSIPCDEDLKKVLLSLSAQYLQSAIDLEPEYFEAFNEQGRIRVTLNELDLAIQSFQNAIKINSAYAEAYYGLGIVYKLTENLKLSALNIEKSISIDSKFLDAYKLLGEIKSQEGDRETAILNYQKVTELEPDSPDAFIMLGCLYTDLGQLHKAIKYTKEAVSLRKNSPDVYFALGNILSTQGKFPEAVENFQHALQLRPDYVDVKNNLASALLAMGRNDDAVEFYRDVVRAQPTHLVALQNVAFCLSFESGVLPAVYLNSAKKFGDVVSSKAKSYISWKQEPLNDRALKVGLVSGDLRQHPVGFFLESVLTYLDIEKIEIHAYSNRTTNDPFQESLKSRVSSWSAIEGLSDEAAAKLIHDAELDLLIDLSGHTGMNRLAMFAWRPAPVQASWLGYWASTGVSEIDYILADRHSVLPEHHHHFSERVWYLADARMCFTPPSAVYELVPSQPPSVKNKHITFGCFQSIRKLNPNVLALWGRIHQQLPDAKFRLQGTGFTDPKISADLLQRLADVGIATSSVSLHASLPGYEYLKCHSEVDIILDCFPFPGGTTTCDAIWMGVPTVTMAGSTMLSRQGVSLLMYAGLPDWVAQSGDEYVAIAVTKASDTKQLSRLRASLRQQVFESALFNAPGFSSSLQDTFIAMVLDKKARFNSAKHSNGLA